MVTRAVRPAKKPAGRYHHGGLADALVAASLEIVREEGSGALSLSAAARRVGVSPQASYNHFTSKEQLLAAAAADVVTRLADHMRAAREKARSPGAALESAGIAYVTFGCARPAELRLLSAPELADKTRHPALLAAYELAFGVLLEAITGAQHAGVVRRGDVRALALPAWAIVHGIASLVIDGQLATSGTEDDPERLARDALRVLFSGLRDRS